MHPEVSQQAILPGPTPRASPATRLRLRGAVLAAVCGGLWAAALTLLPRPSGFGTHQQLALPPCSFLVRTGYPCPSCGVTTAFAAAAHGQLVAAFMAHPFGLLLLVGVVAVGAVGVVELVTGRRVAAALRPRWWWALVALGCMLGGWALKVAVGTATGRLPIP